MSPRRTRHWHLHRQRSASRSWGFAPLSFLLLILSSWSFIILALVLVLVIGTATTVLHAAARPHASAWHPESRTSQSLGGFSMSQIVKQVSSECGLGSRSALRSVPDGVPIAVLDSPHSEETRYARASLPPCLSLSLGLPLHHLPLPNSLSPWICVAPCLSASVPLSLRLSPLPLGLYAFMPLCLSASHPLCLCLPASLSRCHPPSMAHPAPFTFLSPISCLCTPHPLPTSQPVAAALKATMKHCHG